jgi:predicted ATP-binding protein involved in virulence
MLLALVADLARRLALANPYRENPLLGNGVVLIDEMDLHLHPRRQRDVIPQLQETFPNCQFIVTTHSPLILSNLRRENVIILEDFKTIKKTPHTFGRDNNSILYELMGVTQRSAEMQERLNKCYELIDNDQLEEAEACFKKLSEDLGPNDPDIVRGETAINFRKA